MILALRSWWLVVVAFTAIGAVVGMAANGGAPYAATSMLLVDVSTNPLQSPQIVSTALQLTDSDPVFFRATNNTQAAADELRSRTTVGVSDSATVLAVRVVAPTAQQAVADADRFAKAAVDQSVAKANDDFNRVTQLGQEALHQGILADKAAEAKRLEQLGGNVADSQNAASRSTTLITRIGGVLPPEHLGLPTKLAAPVGAGAGAILGIVVALILGVRRRRIRRVRDVTAVGPEIRVYDAKTLDKGLLQLAGRCAKIDQPLVAMLALPGAEDALASLVDVFTAKLSEEALRAVTIDADDFGARAFASRRTADDAIVEIPQRNARGEILDASKAHLILVTGLAGRNAVVQAGARADAVILVGRMRHTTIGQLSAVYPDVVDALPIVVLVPHSGRVGTKHETAAVTPTEIEEFVLEDFKLDEEPSALLPLREAATQVAALNGSRLPQDAGRESEARDNHVTDNHVTDNHVAQNNFGDDRVAENHITDYHFLDYVRADGYFTKDHLSDNPVTENHVTENHVTENHVAETLKLRAVQGKSAVQDTDGATAPETTSPEDETQTAEADNQTPRADKTTESPESAAASEKAESSEDAAPSQASESADTLVSFPSPANESPLNGRADVTKDETPRAAEDQKAEPEIRRMRPSPVPR